MGTRFAARNATEPLLASADVSNLRTQFNALRADVSAIRTALLSTHTKLDGDAGISDTDYSTNDPASMTSADLTVR